MKKNKKYLSVMLTFICFIMIFSGCGNREVNIPTVGQEETDTDFVQKESDTDVSLKESGDDTTPDISDEENTQDEEVADTDETEGFISTAYKYFTDLDYSDRFAIGIICIMLTESGGDPSYVEYSYKFPNEYHDFLSHKADSNRDLLEAYHTYGDAVFAENESDTDMYRDDEGDFCVGVGIMLWTGDRGDELLNSARNDWTDLGFQLDHLAGQLTDAGLTPDNTTGFEVYEDAVNTIAYKFLMVPEDSAHLDEYASYIDRVEKSVHE